MIFAYIFLIGMPAFLIFFVIKKILKARNIMQQGVRTGAIVNHIYTQRLSKGGSIDMLTLEYKDSVGRTYPAKGTVTTGKYKVGQRISITYLPQDPTQYAIDKGQGYWALLIFCILLQLFTIFATYKIHEMMQGRHYYFRG